MIEALKKYPKTWKRFEDYMKKFVNKSSNSHNSIECTSLDLKIYCSRCDCVTFFDMPPQFLIGCLMEFLGENRISISANSLSGFDLNVCIAAFEILEEREANEDN